MLSLLLLLTVVVLLSGSRMLDIILFFNCDLLIRDRSVFRALLKWFQSSMQCLVIELSPYLVVERYGVNKHPRSELMVLVV